MIETLERQLKEMHAEKVKNERWEHHCREIRGDNIYLDFCIWCNCYADNNTKTDISAFAEWLKKENRTLTFWQRKHILETYFNYKFDWNGNESKWEIKKWNT